LIFLVADAPPHLDYPQDFDYAQEMAVAAANALIDSLGLNAIISDPKTAKENTVAQINEQNPKRLDVALTVQLSGNTNIISVDLNFGFYFGTATPVA